MLEKKTCSCKRFVWVDEYSIWYDSVALDIYFNDIDFIYCPHCNDQLFNNGVTALWEKTEDTHRIYTDGPPLLFFNEEPQRTCSCGYCDVGLDAADSYSFYFKNQSNHCCNFCPECGDRCVAGNGYIIRLKKINELLGIICLGFWHNDIQKNK